MAPTAEEKMLEKRNIAKVVGDSAVSMPPYCKIFPTMESCGTPPKRPYRLRVWVVPVASLVTAVVMENNIQKDGV